MATSARLEELLQKFGENPRRYFAPLANEHRKLGDLDEAITLCRTHLPQQPQHVSGHIVLAQALFEAGNAADARETFEHALDLDPENLIALRYLGDIARTEGDYSAARQWYERVLDADPRNDEIARLVREIESGAAVAAARAAETVVAAPTPEPPVTAEVAPNEETPATFEARAAHTPESAQIDDLATVWQHEVSALESQPEFVVEMPGAEPEAPGAREPEKSPEPELISIDALAPSEPEPYEPEPHEPEPSVPSEREAEPVAFEPAEEPNEAWAEPAEEFIETAAHVESLAPPVTATFTEIDYSMFEAVADEEEVVASAVPAPQDEVQTPVEAVADATPAHGDDWFASPSGRDAEAPAVEAANEASFDLDAAFQSVLPNSESEAEDVFEAQSALANFDATPVANANEWVPENIDRPLDEMPVAESFQPADSVDDAFAELDRLTASLEGEASGSAMLLPDEEYVVEEYVQEFVVEQVAEVSEELRASIARTPEMGVPAVEAAPAAFVTETMAELYLQQGFREEAMAVYRQLLVMNPEDSLLAARVAALEGALPEHAAASQAASEPMQVPSRPRADSAGQSMRAFLGVFARRRAPMRRRDAVGQAAAPAAPESRLSALFGATNGSDDGAAAVLAGAFAQPNADHESLPGRPTRAASAELSLGDVFGGGMATSTARAATFDEFFSAGNADQAPSSPLDEEGSDMVQFTAWLEGLKKK